MLISTAGVIRPRREGSLAGGRRIASTNLRALAPVVPLLLAAAFLAAPVAGLADQDESVRDYQLLPQVHGLVRPDCSFDLQQDVGATVSPLLRVFLPLPVTRRAAGPEGEAFTARLAEGAPGGRRGFARDADDDGDGQIDEDRLDGLDNDGDGLFDEDFAAVSDAMTVVARLAGGRRQHLEAYHWGYSHLSSTVALFLRQADSSDRGRDSKVVVELQAGDWRRTCVTCPGSHGAADHDLAAALETTAGPRCGTAYVAAVPDPATPGSLLWLASTPLTTSGSRSAAELRRIRLAGGRLEIPLDSEGASLAISVAPTLSQLQANLAAAHGVFHGACDLGGRREVAWIVSAASLAYRTGTEPAVRGERSGRRSLTLRFAVFPGDNALFDPDLFTLDDSPLGSPRSIRWTGRSGSAAGAPSRRAWQERVPEDLDLLAESELDPYHGWADLKAGEGEGELVFEFETGGPQANAPIHAVLGGRYLQGKPFRAELEIAAPQAVAPQGSTPGEADSYAQLQGRRSPSLNPKLLENFPNPFQDETRIRYHIPRTIEEGFVWEEGAAPQLSPQSNIPYQSIPPTISLKIYSLDGREIATLFTGSESLGFHEAVWNGADASGRTVASGTYFCKLQIENWSVTKRLIFVR